MKRQRSRRSAGATLAVAGTALVIGGPALGHDERPDPRDNGHIAPDGSVIPETLEHHAPLSLTDIWRSVNPSGVADGHVVVCRDSPSDSVTVVLERKVGKHVKLRPGQERTKPAPHPCEGKAEVMGR